MRGEPLQREREVTPLVDRRQQRHIQGQRWRSAGRPAQMRRLVGDRVGVFSCLARGRGGWAWSSTRSRTRSHRVIAHGPHSTGRRRPDEESIQGSVRDRRRAVGNGDIAGGQRGQVLVRHPRQSGKAPAGSGPAGRTFLGSTHDWATPAAPPPPRPRSRPESGVVRRWAGPARPTPPPTARAAQPGRGMMVIDRGDPPPLGRRAAGQSARNAITVAGSAGSSRWPVTAHQSVNNAQAVA